MKKRFLTTVALAIGFSSLSALPAAIEPATVQAATVQNNNQAVALKANQLINTAKGLIGKAVGFAPMIGLFVGYLIVPLVIIGVTKMSGTFSQLGG